MRATLALVRHSVRRDRSMLAAITLVLAGVQVLMVFAGRALQASGAFSGLTALIPPMVRDMFGDSLISFMSFAGLVGFGYFHPMIVAALVALMIAVGTEVASEVETRFLDLILARPVSRPAVLTRSVVLVLLTPSMVLAAMVAATSFALAWLTPAGVQPPGSRLIASLALNLWCLLFAVGALSLAAATLGRRRSVVAGTCGIVGFSLYLIDYLSRVWRPAQEVAWLSPFHYYNAMEMLLGRPLPTAHLVTLAAIGLCAIALAYYCFARRDV